MRFFARRGPVALCLLALSGWLVAVAVEAATLYKWVDADGVVHYSDTPHPGAEKIQISGAQTYHSTPVPAASSGPAPPAAGATRPGLDRTCSISEPAADAALYAPETVGISVQTSPGLGDGELIVAQLDGQALGAGSPDGHFVVASPERGSHTITAQVHGADGAVLCNAAPVSFSVQQPSLNSPQSPLRPAPAPPRPH